MTTKTGNFRQMWFCSDWYLYFWFRYSDQGISRVEEINIATSSITMQATIINRKLLYKWLCWTILTMLPINIM
jgi:hypothetical protein